MIRPNESIFIDTGAWIALAIVKDALHERAAAHWNILQLKGARLFTSVPVAVEAFTYLDRRGSRELALQWSSSLNSIARFEILGCSSADLHEAWRYLEQKQFYKLSFVDATSFVLMRKHHIRVAFAFDTHFAQAGFRLEA